MVFDASAPTSGIALNSCLHPGPSLTPSLFGTLLRFRTKQYAFISDIEKAFLQISLNEKDRDFVRFIWYDDTDNINSKNLDESKKAIYRLCRVLFGVTSSPFLLNGTLKLHIENSSNNSIYTQQLVRSLHVDDLIAGANNVNDVAAFITGAEIF